MIHSATISPHKPLNSYNKTNKSKLNNESKLINSIIKNIAKETLKELVVGAAMTAVAACFVATPAIPTLCIMAISLIAFNVLMRSMSAFAAYQLNDKDYVQQIHPWHRNVLEYFAKISEYGCPTNFAHLANSTLGVLIHEGGHALAATVLFRKAHASIEILPLKGGVTKYYASSLSRIGEKLGHRLSLATVSAAGPAAAILTASALIGVAHHNEDKHPKISLYMMACGISIVVQHVLYALSAFSRKNVPGHDFADLWKKAHIHPVISAAAMIAIPLLVVTAINKKSKSKKPWTRLTTLVAFNTTLT